MNLNNVVSPVFAEYDDRFRSQSSHVLSPVMVGKQRPATNIMLMDAKLSPPLLLLSSLSPENSKRKLHPEAALLTPKRNRRRAKSLPKKRLKTNEVGQSVVLQQQSFVSNSCSFVSQFGASSPWWSGSFSYSEEDAVWKVCFQMLGWFKQWKGDCLVPKDYPPNPRLAYWVVKQRKLYRRKKKRRERLFKQLEKQQLRQQQKQRNESDPLSTTSCNISSSCRALLLLENNDNDPKEEQLQDLGFCFHPKTRVILAIQALEKFDKVWRSLYINKNHCYYSCSSYSNRAAVSLASWNRDVRFASCYMRKRRQQQQQQQEQLQQEQQPKLLELQEQQQEQQENEHNSQQQSEQELHQQQQQQQQQQREQQQNQEKYLNELWQQNFRMKVSSAAAATTIQSFWPNAFAAAVKIQARWRSSLETRRFQKAKQSIVTLQSGWREQKRIRINKRKRKEEDDRAAASAIRIEILVRGFLVRNKRILVKECAARLLQARLIEYYRTLQLQKVQSRSSILIQALVRGWMARNRYNRTKEACLVIQFNFRVQMSRIRVLVAKEEQQKREALRNEAAASLMQRYIRKYLDHCRWIELVSRFIRLQALQRMRLVRSNFLCHVSASIVIQRYWRCHRFCSRYKSSCRSFVRLQALWRMRLSTVRYQKFLSAMCLIAQQLQRHALKKRYCALVIQTNTRRYMQQKVYMGYLNSATKIQTLFRVALERKHTEALKSKCVLIQAYERMRLARRYVASLKVERKKCRASIMIQKMWRAFDIQRQYDRYLSSTILIQAKWRALLIKQNYSEARLACIQIQAQMRCKFARQLRDRLNLDRKNKALTRVQKTWRGFKSYSQFNTLKRCSIFVQSLQRRRITRKDFMHEMMARHFATTAFQRVWRAFKTRRKFLTLLRDVVVLQTFVRTRQCRTTYLAMRKSQITIAKNWRAEQAASKYWNLRSSVILFQAFVRMLSARRKFIESKSSLVIQNHIRSFLAQLLKSRLIAVREKIKAAVLIQKCIRGYFDKIKYVRLQQSVLMLQARQRRCSARAGLLKKRNAAIVIQWSLRGFEARRHYLELRKSCLGIQAYFRCFLAGRLLSRLKFDAEKMKAITNLQSFVRGYSERDKFKRLQQSVLILQAHQRKILVTSVMLKQKKAAITINN